MVKEIGAAGGMSETRTGRLIANRRQMLLGASLGALFATAGAAMPAPARMTPMRAGPVLSFHRDEPWLDPAGLASPYRPPHGVRGGAVGAALSDEALRRLDCYL